MKDYKEHIEQKDSLKIAQQNGIDIAMLKDNLSSSYAERIRRHQIALDTMQKLQKAKDA